MAMTLCTSSSRRCTKWVEGKVSESCFWNFQRKLKSLNFANLIFRHRHRKLGVFLRPTDCCDHGDLLYLLKEIPVDVFAAGNFSLKHHFVELGLPDKCETSPIKSLNISFPSLEMQFLSTEWTIWSHEITTKHSFSERTYENLVAHGQTAILIICLH